MQIFKKYIEIELQLGNMDRCRKLYEKYLEWSPENCYAWSKFAELERSLDETERARAIFELAIAQPALDMPELLWKVPLYPSMCLYICVHFYFIRLLNTINIGWTEVKYISILTTILSSSVLCSRF